MPTALVVDDDPAVQHLTRQVLSDEGFIVQTTATAVDAMAWLRGEDVDLLLVDVKLNGMDGLTRRRGGVLERLLHHGELPVVVRVAQPAPARVVFGARAASGEAAAYGIAGCHACNSARWWLP